MISTGKYFIRERERERVNSVVALYWTTNTIVDLLTDGRPGDNSYISEFHRLSRVVGHSVGQDEDGVRGAKTRYKDNNTILNIVYPRCALAFVSL